MSLPKVIYVMGPPGAGKGTQAELLAQHLKYHRFSTGDAFRSVSHQATELGKKVKELIDNGYLAPPELAAEIVITAIREHLQAGHGLIFDGTPRTIEEAAIVDKFFLDEGYGKPLAIILNLDKAEMARRNSQRKFCLGIQGGFAVLNAADEQRCVDKGGHLGTRPDDEPAKFETRWQEFAQRTLPVIEQYRRQGIAAEVDGLQSIAAVNQAVLEVINSRYHG